jgi:hypothetical protein
MEITETKHEFALGDYLARVYFGEYGSHTDWFKGDYGIKSDEVPDDIQDKVDRMIEEIF